MSSIHSKVIEASKKINMVVGSLGYESLVAKYTAEFLESLSKTDNERRFVFDFMAMANSYDVDAIVTYMIQNAYPTELLELGISLTGDNTLIILHGYIARTCENKEEPEEIKTHKLMFLFSNAFKLWPHITIDMIDWMTSNWFRNEFVDDMETVRIINLLYTEWLLNVKFTLDCGVTTSVVERILDMILASREWNVYARVFLKYPALINIYDERYKVKETLGDVSEKNHETIAKFVSEIYTTHPMDIALHSWILALFNNSYMLDCFTKESTKNIDAMAEMDMFKNMNRSST